MRSVWDFREIGLFKMLFSDAITEYMADRSSGLWVRPTGEMYVANFGGTGLSGTYSFSCTACWPAA